MIIDHQRFPGGEGRRWEGGGFMVGPIFWSVGKGGDRASDSGSGIAVDAIPWHLAKAIPGRFAGDPLWKESADDAIAHFKFGHLTTPINHFACAIG